MENPTLRAVANVTAMAQVEAEKREGRFRKFNKNPGREIRKRFAFLADQNYEELAQGSAREGK